jgi:hypothetical protein
MRGWGLGAIGWESQSVVRFCIIHIELFGSVSQIWSVIWCWALDDRILQCSTSGGNSFAITYSLKIPCNTSNISFPFLCLVIRLTYHYVFIYLCIFSRPFWHNNLTTQLSCGSHALRSDTLSLFLYYFISAVSRSHWKRLSVNFLILKQDIIILRSSNQNYKLWG